MGYSETRQVAHVNPLVVEAAALGAGDQVEELLRLGGRVVGGVCGTREHQAIRTSFP